MTLTSTVALVATMLLLSATPGPVDLVLVAYAIQRGWKTSLLMVLGIVVADFVFIGFVLAGLGYVAQTFQTAFLGFRILAVVLLFWFGWRFIAAKPASNHSLQPALPLNGFLSGFTLTFGDPKAILFYMSFLPAYLDIQSARIFDALVVMLSATLAIGVVKITYIGLAQQAQNWLGSDAVQGVMHRLAGGVLCGVGIYLLVQLIMEFV